MCAYDGGKSANGRHRDFACSLGEVLKSEALEITCHRAQCRYAECCDVKIISCDGFECPANGGWKLIGDPASKQCKRLPCTTRECCENFGTCASTRFRCPANVGGIAAGGGGGALGGVPFKSKGDASSE
jgi:hypothetical protein